MNDAITVKKWKIMETMLFQAAEFLHNPALFELKEQDFGNYRFNSREEELKEAMKQLEKISISSGAKSGFWRRIKKAAEQCENSIKANEYEEQFHKALAKNV